jgi:hypothetical protein
MCLPGVGEALMGAMGGRTVRGHVDGCLAPNPTPADRAAHAELLALVDGQLSEHPGFLRALLSSVRHTITRDMEPAFAAWATAGRPTLLVWGAQDKVVDFRGSARALQLVPSARLVVIEGAGHNIAAQVRGCCCCCARAARAILMDARVHCSPSISTPWTRFSSLCPCSSSSSVWCSCSLFACSGCGVCVCVHVLSTGRNFIRVRERCEPSRAHGMTKGVFTNQHAHSYKTR